MQVSKKKLLIIPGGKYGEKTINKQYLITLFPTFVQQPLYRL